MIALIKPILFAFFKSDAVKKLLVDLLDKLAKETDNDLDDTAVNALRIALKVWDDVRSSFGTHDALPWNGGRVIGTYYENSSCLSWCSILHYSLSLVTWWEVRFLPQQSGIEPSRGHLFADRSGNT